MIDFEKRIMKNGVLFLGGTCNNSNWRDELIPMLESAGVKYFNPVVPDWTPECIEIENEIKAKQNTIELYLITKEMKGVYSIAEAVDASHKRPKQVIFGFNAWGFDDAQVRSLKAVQNLVKENGVTIIHSNDDIIRAAKRMMCL